ncbi:lactate racemase domain-containing protein [Vulgatibacter incomptus]|uniref:Transcriptional regulator n=1 Tax=Vulgatibacter incomptus TaxID=1391653 RepID=A0A0K1P913_9BACT|nr:lactate racemase domain-containing protein [Vulgatibacter incomptus]AKU89997.1 Transcriptional regulator [Vulgatibacter incomptus]
MPNASCAHPHLAAGQARASELRYGRGSLALPDRLRDAIRLRGSEPPPVPDPRATLEGALARPLGAPSLAVFVEPGDRVAIVVQHGLEALAGAVLDRIREVVLGSGASAISIRTARGTTLGDPFPGGTDAQGVLFEPLGRARGLGVVRVDREVARADKLVLVGGTSFDPLAGFGGGAALVATGCADEATISAILRAGDTQSAAPGILESNPVHEAIRTAAALAPPAFLVQLDFQRGGRLAGVFAGDPDLAFAAAVAFHSKWHRITLEKPLDLVVASAGGDPFDRRLSDALPALAAACNAVRPGGAVILCAECPEEDAPGVAALSWLVTGIASGRITSARIASRVECAIISRAHPASILGVRGIRAVSDIAEALELIPAGRAGILEDGRTLPLVTAPAPR